MPRPSGLAERARALAAPAAVALLPFVYFWRATLGRVVLLNGDAPALHFPFRLLLGAYLRAGYLPLWNPAVFSGFPFLGALQPAVLYPATWLFLICSPALAMNLQVITSHSIAGLGTYAYARAVGCRRLAAVFAAVTFAFSGFLFARVGHTGILQAAAWLPVLLWALERVRQCGAARFVLAGAGALACMVFAGHPQLPAYAVLLAGAYVVFFTLGEPAPIGRVRFAVLALLTVGGGIGLSAVQLLPTAELAGQSVRARLSFAEFASFSLPLRQLPVLLFPLLFGDGTRSPYWGGAQFLGEVTAYVGVAAPMLALAALARLRGSAVVRLWALIAVGGVLLALGDSLPLARLTYHLPIYNSFRAHVRVLVIVDFALAVLAALGLDHLGRRAAARAVVLVVGAVLGVAGLALAAGERIWGPLARLTVGELAWRDVLGAALAPANPALVVPLLLSVVAAALVLACAYRPRAPLPWALLAFQVFDLWRFGAQLPNWFPPADLIGQPPPDVFWLRQLEPEPFTFRTALAVAGQVDSVPQRSDWQHPMIGGYDPMIMQRYRDFAGDMLYWGAIPEPTLRDRPAFLDLLNAKYLFLTFPERGAFARRVAGVLFAFNELALRLSPGQSAEYTLPGPQPTGVVALVTALHGAAALPDGAEVARITLRDAAGREQSVLLRAGEHTADAEWQQANPAAPMRHRHAAVAEVAPGGGERYVALLPMAPAIDAERLRIESLLPSGEIEVARLTLQDPVTGAVHPLTVSHALLDQPERWARRLSTPRLAVLENRRVLPRAWLARETVALAPEAVLATIRTQTLPDGRAFDPRTTALVEDRPGAVLAPGDPGARADVTANEPNALEIDTVSAGNAFLVLSEIYYPGWSATVDGAPAEIVRTDYVLRGVALPPGAHHVRLAYRPRSVLFGLAISLASAVLVPLLALWVRR